MPECFVGIKNDVMVFKDVVHSGDDRQIHAVRTLQGPDENTREIPREIYLRATVQQDEFAHYMQETLWQCMKDDVRCCCEDLDERAGSMIARAQ